MWYIKYKLIQLTLNERSPMPEKVKNAPTVRRMPIYLHRLLQLEQEGKESISTTELAEALNLDLIVVRKDISLTGIAGFRRIGYNIQDLIRSIKKYVGWEIPLRAAVIGASPSGYAMSVYRDFPLFGVTVESVYDEDVEKAKRLYGDDAGRFAFYNMAEMETRLQADKPDMVILTVPAVNAQKIAEAAVNAGIKYIWNFTGVALRLPPDVTVQRETIAGSLATLTAKMKLDRK